MCGIVGLVSLRGDRRDLIEQIRGMASSLSHRGPDDKGEWVDCDAGIALGHRRLSILDLSPEGHQPMSSASGRYTICFNGEIYNFGELREELESSGHQLRGHSDTEVMLAAFEQLGKDKSIMRLKSRIAWNS